MLKTFIKKVFQGLLPSLYWNLLFTKLRKDFDEKEMYLLPYLTNSDKTSIDIGAAQGVFIVNLAPLSDKVVAFEPIPKNIGLLTSVIKYLKTDVKLMPVALSDNEGETVLRIVENDLGRSTIEEANKLESGVDIKKTSITVPIKTLDSYNFTNVGFIKIDVEGHELSVVKGGQNTIAKNKPSVLIEIEERHKPNSITDMNHFMSQYGYDGFYLLNNELVPLEEFDISTFQDPTKIGDASNHYKRFGIYINNFIFLQPDNVKKVRAALTKNDN